MPQLPFIFLLTCWLWSGGALALDSRLALSDYRHDSWSSKDGAPGSVSAMAQTADGWIWLGTGSGLYRFDGFRFQQFVPQGKEQLQKRHVSALRPLADGTLLVGYVSGGVDRIVNGRVQPYPSRPDGKQFGPVWGLEVDADGAPLVASSEGLLRWHDGRWEEFGKLAGLPPGVVSDIVTDQYGQLWIVRNERLYVYGPTPGRFREVMRVTDGANLIASPDGRLWVDNNRKLALVPQPLPNPVKPRAESMRVMAQGGGLFDRDGNFWALRCPAAICRTRALGMAASAVVEASPEPDDRIDQRYQLSSLATSAVLEDREGNIWIGTMGGLERFRHNALLPVGVDPAELSFNLARDGNGTVWAKAYLGGSLARLTPDGRVAATEAGLPKNTIASAQDGSLLVARGCAIERRLGAQRVILSLPAAVKPDTECLISKMVDDGEALWVNLSGHATYRYAAGTWTPTASLGMPDLMPFVATGARGEAWLADRSGTIYRYAEGKASRLPGSPLADFGAITFLDGATGALLVGTDRALLVRRGAHFQPMRVSDSAVLGAVSGIALDDDGNRWINGSRGLVKITKPDWQAALAEPALTVRFELFDALDGYPGEASTALRLPTALKDGSGQLWFVGTAGMARLDPRAIHHNTAPPPSAITAVFAGAERYAPAGTLALPPRPGSIRIEYAALSYTMPEKITFRHRLDGLDTHWQDGGSRRASEYTNLDPGPYRFRLKAVNEAGIESKDEAVVAFEIAPALYQTRAFKAACIAALLLLLYLAYRWRIAQVSTKFRAEIQARQHERERIARALHDTLLQGVQSLTVRAQSAINQLPPQAPVRVNMEAILDSADQMMVDGRDQVMDLRASMEYGSDLHATLKSTVESMALEYGVKSGFSAAGLVQPTQALVNDDIYCIAREALSNAFRHAAAKRVDVHLNYGSETFALHVRDDGLGIDDAVLEAGGRHGHWGLTGMRERAQGIGGILDIKSGTGKGTEVVLTLPSENVYTGAVSSLTRRWFDRYVLRRRN